jgi:broad specificity phosphatase PhoE
MIPLKHFYMIRHGETEANASHIMAGSLDSPLTALGRKQAENVREIVKTLTIKPKTILHSPLSRAKETAQIINSVLDVPMVEDADLAELHAGDWEGRPYSECNLLLSGWVDCPGGETAKDFFARVKRAKMRALSRAEEPVLVVCHGGVMRAFGRIYGREAPARFRNCHLHEYVPAPHIEGFPWEVWNYDHPELIPDLSTELPTRTKCDFYDNIDILSGS